MDKKKDVFNTLEEDGPQIGICEICESPIFENDGYRDYDDHGGIYCNRCFERNSEDDYEFILINSQINSTICYSN